MQILKENPNLNNETEFTQFWNFVLNSNKSLFLNENYLFQLTDDGIVIMKYNNMQFINIFVFIIIDTNLVLNKICMFSLLVLNMKFDQINGSVEPYLRSIIVSLLSIKSPVRKECKTNVLKAVSSNYNSKLATSLLNEITNFLECNV